MATEATGASETAPTNGVSSSTDDARAAFISMVGEEPPAEKPAEKAEKPAPDDDSDLDDEDSDKETTSDDADLDEDDDEKPAEDADADLDEEDDEKEDDARIAKVRRTDKRLRERREADFKARESQIQRTVEQWQPKIEKAERFEKLAERAKNPYEIVEVLRELGVNEDDFETASQAIFAHSKKFATDPKARETVAKLKADREVREELNDLKKWKQERETREREASEAADAEKRVSVFIDGATKAASEKTPLAAALIAKNPDRARAQIAELTARHIDEHGQMPTPKQVIIALEKSRRQDLRDLGIDPKSRGAAAKADKVEADATKTTKKVDKKTEATKPKVEAKPLTKEDFINRNFD